MMMISSISCAVWFDMMKRTFDAIYYATPNGAELLAEVENYLHDHLIYEVRDYYTAKMAGHDY